MFQRQPTRSFTRRRRILAPLLAAAFVLSFASALTMSAAHQHLSDPQFYKQALDNQNAYDRAYDDVLFDRDLTRQVEELLGGVKIPRREIKAVVREIAPPAKLRSAVEAAIDRVVEHMNTGEELVLAIDVTAFVQAIADAVISFTIDAVIALPEERSASYEDFVTQFAATLEDLDQGTIPSAIPSYPIPEEDVQTVASIVFAVGHIDPRSELGEAVSEAVAQDDVAGAIKVATASILVDLVATSIDELVAQLDTGPDGEILLAAPAPVVRKIEDELVLPRRILNAAAVGRAASGAVALAALTALVVLYLPDWRRTLRWAGGTLAGAGIFTFVFWLIARGQLVGRISDIAVKKTAGFPQSFSVLVDDVLHAAASEIDPAFQLAAAAALVVGAVMVGASFAIRAQAPAAA